MATPTSVAGKRRAPTVRFASDLWFCVLAVGMLSPIAAFALFTIVTKFSVRSLKIRGRAISTSKISAAAAALSVVLLPIFANILTVLGRRWLYSHIKRGRPLTIGNWQALATNGAIFTLPWGWKIFHGLFPFALGLYWVLSSAISATIVPSLVINLFTTSVPIVSIADGAFAPRGWAMTDCFINNSDFSAGWDNCPATLDTGSILTTMSYSLFLESSTSSDTDYYAGGYRFDNATFIAGQPVLASLWRQSSLTEEEVRNITACLPTVDPVVTCQAMKYKEAYAGVVGFTPDGNYMTYEAPCPAPWTEYIRINSTSKSGAASNWCANEPGATTDILYFVAYDEGKTDGWPIGVVNCTVSVYEGIRHINYDAQIRQFTDISAGNDAEYALTLPDLRPLTASVVDVASASQTGFGDNTFSNAILGSGSGSWERAIADGLRAAAQVLYGLMLEVQDGYGPTSWNVTSAEISSEAYGWNRGWTGQIWTGIILGAWTLAIFTCMIGLRPRTRYDPSSWAQTLFIRLHSRGVEPPSGTDMGHLPRKYRSVKLHYGFDGEGQPARFFSKPDGGEQPRPSINHALSY